MPANRQLLPGFPGKMRFSASVPGAQRETARSSDGFRGKSTSSIADSGRVTGIILANSVSAPAGRVLLRIFQRRKKWCRKPGVLPGDIVFKIEFNSVIANKLSAHLTGTDSIDGAA